MDQIIVGKKDVGVDVTGKNNIFPFFAATEDNNQP